MLAGRLDEVARIAHAEGGDGLAALRLELFRPLEPMLAQTAGSPEEAYDKLDGELALEWKLDGRARAGAP